MKNYSENKNKHIVHIEGYWLLENIRCDLKTKGIFFIYECIYHQKTDTVEIKDLLYIGSSDNLKNEIESVISKTNILEILPNNRKLCCSYAAIMDPTLRQRIVNQYIHFMKPKLNQSIPIQWDEIDYSSVISIGDIALLEPVCANYVLQ